MTSGDAAHRRSGSLARGWRSFRRWRRARPFWAGLFTLLGGLQIYASTQLSIGDIQLKIGMEGFLSYVIPLVLMLCGLLTWFTPQQRLFYGVIAVVVSLYSFIGVNFGGFFIGMLLGIVGGALAVAWTPVKPAQPVPAADETPEEDRDQRPDGEEPDGEEEAGHRSEATVDELFTGPLTDVLPQPVNPLTDPYPRTQSYEERSYAEPAEETTQQIPRQWPPGPSQDHDPNGPLPRRTPRLFVITLVPLLLGAAMVFADARVIPSAGAAPPAYPSPCPKASPSTSGGPRPGASATKSPEESPDGSKRPTASRSPSPSPTPSGSPGSTQDGGSTEDEGNPIGDVIDGIGDAIGDLLGGADPTPAPSPSATSGRPSAPRAPAPPAPPGSGSASSSASASPSAKPTKSASPTPTPSASCVEVNAKQLAAPAGQPVVQQRPDRMLGTKLTLEGFAFDGVTELPTATGSIRVLQFSMDKSVTENFELRVPGPAERTISLKSSALTVQKVNDKVKFFCSRFEGTLVLAVGGIEIPTPIRLTFNPDQPPPLTLPTMVFTDIDIELVFVDTDELLAPDLDTRFL